MKFSKKIISICCAMAMGITSFAFSGCGNGNSNALMIGYLSAGYGDAWIDTIAKEYTEMTGVEIILDGDSQFSSKVINELGSGSTDYDIMITESSNWSSFAANGSLAILNEVFSSTDEEGNTLESRYKSNALHYARATGSDKQDGYYSIPLFASIGGIVYNVEMFEYYNWKIPTTVSELVTLCARIKSDTAKRKWKTKSGESVTVAPFVYPGQYNFYWDFIIYNWWCQYDGIDTVAAAYSPESKTAMLTEGMKQAMRAFEMLNVKSGENSNSLSGSESKDHTNANTDFANGLAAMMPSGSWAETEIIKNVEDPYEIGLMPNIYIDANHKNNFSYTISVVNTFVPSMSDNISGAKEFLKFLTKPETLQTVTKLSGGIHPLEYNLSSIKSECSDFMQQVINIHEKYVPIYPISSHPMVKYGISQPWPLGSAAKMMLSGNYADYNDVYNTIGRYIDENWETWQQKIKNYLG